MQGLIIRSVGSCVPPKVVTNDELSKIVDTNDEWIRSRTGMCSRRFCSDGEDATTLAVGAAKQALQRSGLQANQIDCCICATLSPVNAAPSLACLVQKELGLPENIPVLDVNAACSGFGYALCVANGLLAMTNGKNALVIGCEQLSRLMDMQDRNTCVLFGDGAGAAVVSVDEAPLIHVLGARGDYAIQVEGPGPDTAKIKMDGRAVYRFATEMLPKCVQVLFEKSGFGFDDIDHVVCHQANERIIDACIKKLEAPAEKFFKNVDHTGNTSAASIPLALSELYDKGMLKNGDRLMLVGFGAGLTWAGLIITYQGSVQ